MGDVNINIAKLTRGPCRPGGPSRPSRPGLPLSPGSP